ncbi:MAG: peroxiredoxin [Chloroflexota bacterium]
MTQGELAPDFELISDEGTPVKLSELRGQKVVLFYPKADTPGCTTQACGFRDNWPVIEAAGATVPGHRPRQPGKAGQMACQSGISLQFTL